MIDVALGGLVQLARVSVLTAVVMAFVCSLMAHAFNAHVNPDFTDLNAIFLVRRIVSLVNTQRIVSSVTMVGMDMIVVINVQEAAFRAPQIPHVAGV